MAEQLASTLKLHYLIGVTCDHETSMDKASCACSLVDLGWQPSVGDAVDSWINHVVQFVTIEEQDWRVERQAVLDAINLYGDEVLHRALDDIGWMMDGRESDG